MSRAITLPPLSLYIHIPWCAQKCPYCDFNSHALNTALPESEYVIHLIQDLINDLNRFKPALNNRSLHSIFIGGGTPSLFQAKRIYQLLTAIKQVINFNENIEITLEANPGSAEANRLLGYKQAGINRISLGIQSFELEKLQKLGRIHNATEAKNAVNMAKQSGFNNFNIDLMHGLPNQTVPQALDDLQQAMRLKAPHISWYQLTIEPNTSFASRPPILPNEDYLWEIFQQGHQLLIANGYHQYEVSAYSRPHFTCAHNLNYWRFGDYLAIGCGAHGKITAMNGEIIRYSKTKHPKGYMQGQYQYEQKNVCINERPFEFFMNRFRLLEPTPKWQFECYTGLAISSIRKQIDSALAQNFLLETNDHWQVTEHGRLVLNQLLTLFLPD